MGEIISSYGEKKVVEYFEDGMKILIKYGHGVGDLLMFMPAFHRLRDLYPKVDIKLYVECGQEQIFESVREINEDEYDYIFEIHFPMSEGTGFTKGQLCCVSELGIEPVFNIVKLPRKSSPFVAVHFHGTALPDSVGCPEDVAGAIWHDIIDFGKIPIECHFEHVFHNPVNTKFDFIDRHVRTCVANLDNLVGLIQHSFAFIGVASGPFITALSTFPSRTLFLEKHHKLEDYTRLGVAKVNLDKGYLKGSVGNWLASLPE